jgi:hypothetical protein
VYPYKGIGNGAFARNPQEFGKKHEQENDYFSHAAPTLDGSACFSFWAERKCARFPSSLLGEGVVMRRSLNAKWTSVVLSAALLLAGGGLARAQEMKQAKGPDIDVVLCFDVSSGMQGLSGSARLKLWDLVNDLGKIKPPPNLRVGLYSYGHITYDRKTGWVRKESDLTSDLDEVYRKLNALTIRGNDEYVARVCRDAIQQQKWSKDKNALRVIFVCGNEPATQDPEVTLDEVAKMAVKNDIVINAIFCGRDNDHDAAGWKDFATKAKGRFASIDQNRGVTQTISTPNDKELVKLSYQLNTTYLPYGKEGNERAQTQLANDQATYQLGPEAAVTRGNYKVGALYRCDSWDLVDRLKNDPKFDIKKVPESELSDTLKKMKPEEREKHVKDMLAKREDLQKQIQKLSQERDEYLRDLAKKNPSKEDRVFDEAVRGALREQAAAKGIKIPEDSKSRLGY